MSLRRDSESSLRTDSFVRSSIGPRDFLDYCVVQVGRKWAMLPTDFDLLKSAVAGLWVRSVVGLTNQHHDRHEKAGSVMSSLLIHTEA
jgi:hypothetical protein